MTREIRQAQFAARGKGAECGRFRPHEEAAVSSWVEEMIDKVQIRRVIDPNGGMLLS